MDLQQLRVFRAAAKSSGFTRASEQLGLSQSTVSQHIKQLEDEFGCSLFLRAGKKVFISEAGKLLLIYADRIFTEFKNAEIAVRELSAMKRGTIRLGVGATTLTYQLPKVLGEYKRRYPDIELIVITGTTESLLNQVISQTVDLAIVMQVSDAPANILITPLESEELVVILNAEHPLARKNALDPEDMTNLPFILYERHTAMQNLIDSFFAQMKVSPRISMQLENIEAIKSLVSAGLGASIVPFCSVSMIPQVSVFRVMRVKGFTLERALALATLDAERLPAAIDKLAAQLIRALPPNQSKARSSRPVTIVNADGLLRPHK
jgi:DNA-binding transcriptional LysR family regulator